MGRGGVRRFGRKASLPFFVCLVMEISSVFRWLKRCGDDYQKEKSIRFMLSGFSIFHFSFIINFNGYGILDKDCFRNKFH